MEEDILIESYLNGTLEGEERKAFEKRMTVDTAFTEEVKSYKSVINSVRVYDDLHFREQMKEWEKKIEVQEKKSIWKRIGFLLVFVVLAAFLIYRISNNDSGKIPILLPIASFETDCTVCRLPATVSFINKSQNASSYQWDFGDGATSEEENPSHFYSSIGIYTVKLTAIQREQYDEFTIVIPKDKAAGPGFEEDSSFVSEPIKITRNRKMITQKGANDGVIFINVTGGVKPYTYVWNDKITTRNRKNLPPGTYSVTVTDANQTKKNISITIKEPEPPTSPDNSSKINKRAVALADSYLSAEKHQFSILRGPNEEALEKEWKDAFENEEYEKAFSALEQIIETEGPGDETLYHAAVSQLELKDYASAIDYFEQLIEKDSGYESESRWYAALIYLKLGNKEAAVKWLKQLYTPHPEHGEYYFHKPEEAKTLVAELEK